MDKLRRVGGEFKAISPTSEHAILAIAGYASTNDVDAYNEIVEPTAFAETMPQYMKHPILLFGHDWYSKPVGKIVRWTIDEKGLWVEAEIADTEAGRDVATLIEFGILKAFSIGFNVLSKEDPLETNDPSIIKKLRLWEISVVNVPANAEALINEAARKQVSMKTIPLTDALRAIEASQRKESSMGGAPHVIDAEVRATLAKVDELASKMSALDTVQVKVRELEENIGKQAKLLEQVQEKADQLKKGLITEAEFNTFCDKIGGDVLTLQKDIKTAKEANKIESGQHSFIHMLHASRLIAPLTDDNGNLKSADHQRIWTYLQAPINYEKSGSDGELIKALRQASDRVVLLDAYFRGIQRQGNKRYNGVQSLKAWKEYVDILGMLDPQLVKAMSSESTGYGDEWVPEFQSAELYDFYRLEARIENYFPHFDMPTNPYTWPTKSSGASLYRAGEAAVNNPDEITKSRFGTSKVTFNAETFAVAIPCSPELSEDSIVNIASEIQREMAITGAHGYESLVINGDNTATHRDTQAGYTAANPETYEDGLRYIAVDRSATLNTQSTTANYGDASSAFAAKDVRYLRQLMGVYGRRPSECFYITSLTPFFYMMNFAQNEQPGNYGGNATWVSGDLNMFDGCAVEVTGEMVETLGEAGIYDSASTHKGILCANKTAFKVGERRGVTIEYEKNIRTQQMTFVATFRKSFQCMAPTTQDPVAYGYNIE